MSLENTTFWQTGSHEHAVEKLYTGNAVNHDDIHHGYLNFGLWETETGSYLEAAENLVSRLGRELELGPGSRLLDVACGMGEQDLLLHRKFGPLQIDGIDVTRVHIEEANRRAGQARLSNTVRFTHGTATALPFPDASFSHALAIEGPVHFNTRERFANEVHRCLAPGGKLAIADYTLKRKPRTRFEKWVLDATLSLWKIPPQNAVTRQSYAKMLKRLGFVDIAIKEVGAKTIPGYYFEQRRPAFRLHKIRTQGLYQGGLGFVVDIAVYRAFRMGLIEYVLVSARKPKDLGKS